jgi:hypothetical protein
MKTGAFLVLILLAACVARPAPEPAPALDDLAPASLEQGDGARTAEREFEAARGREAVQRVRSASSSVVAVSYQGFPRPVAGPGGRVTFAGPAVNAVLRENGRWLGWKGGRAEPVPAAVSARLDSILADPDLWLEPDEFPSGGCTDAGSLQLAIRHRGRLKSSRQDNCDSRGLAGRLGRIVLDERPEP